MSAIKVSILICTRDRAQDLRQTLEAIGHVRVLPDAMTEIVVVDNASTDDTRLIAKSALLRNGLRVRYVLEGRPGKGFAYNCALAEARGEVLMFTDDDVRPSADWIDGMARPILSGEADAVAGGVKLAEHLERPWLQGDLRGWVACTGGVVDVTKPGCVAGANMAFSRRVLERVPQFDTELGPGALGFYDDAIFWQQIVKAGFRVVGRPDVLIEHHFDEARLTTEEFRKIAAKLGRSLGYVYYHWEHKRVRVPRLRALWYAYRVRMTDLASLFGRGASAAPTYEDLNWRFQLALVTQYVRELGSPRKYEKHGLMRIK